MRTYETQEDDKHLISEYAGAPVVRFPGLDKAELQRLGAAATPVFREIFGDDAQVSAFSSLCGRMDVRGDAKRPIDSLLIEVPDEMVTALDVEAVATALQGLHASVSGLRSQLISK